MTSTISCVAVSVAGRCVCVPAVFSRARGPARVSLCGRLHGAPGADPKFLIRARRVACPGTSVSTALSAQLPCPPPRPPHRGCWDLDSGRATARPEERQWTGWGLAADTHSPRHPDTGTPGTSPSCSRGPTQAPRHKDPRNLLSPPRPLLAPQSHVPHLSDAPRGVCSEVQT